MKRRYVCLWFPYLLSDWSSRENIAQRLLPVVFAGPIRGRMCITAVNEVAQQHAVHTTMVLADAKAAIPELVVIDDKPGRVAKLLKGIGLWCIKFTPVVALDIEGQGLLLESTGCTHLWGGEAAYINAIQDQLLAKGYQVAIAVADTIGAAWAAAHYAGNLSVIKEGRQLEELTALPIEGLRLDAISVERLHKLGFRTLGALVALDSVVLRRRFTDDLVKRIDQFVGKEEEFLVSLRPIVPYTERLPCLEPVRTRKAIEIALEDLLFRLCARLAGEGKGMRKAKLTCQRVDDKIVSILVGTNRPTAHVPHLLSLFLQKISDIEPGLGIELFVLDGLVVQEAPAEQEILWQEDAGLATVDLAELLDRIKGRDPACQINRYLPAQHYWPERSLRPAVCMTEKLNLAWRTDMPRPTRLLHPPQRIDVTAPIPDYPPMLFRYKGEIFTIKRADGPERIEREWWIEQGEHRDYYYVEDEEGRRYWLFRSGHYHDDRPSEWYLHGFFA